MTALMSAAVRAGAEVVLIQEPSVKEEEDRWKEKIMRWKLHLHL
jgi:hypothetical protein